MKKFLTVLTIGVCVIFSGCAEEKTETAVQQAEPAEQTQQAEPETSKYPFPSDTTETGKGKVSVQTQSGDSADGVTPVEFIGKDTDFTQIGLTLENFDGSKEVFIYINEKYVQTEQAGELFQGTLTLVNELLKPGVYTVTAVQYENNDPNGGKVTEFHTTKYQVKMKTE